MHPAIMIRVLCRARHNLRIRLAAYTEVDADPHSPVSVVYVISISVIGVLRR
jgi:hypothetical protein